MKITTVIGTRPEAIKLAPVVHQAQAHPNVESQVLLTAQHREMLDQVLDAFDISADIDLDLMAPNQSLESLTAKLITGVGAALRELKPDFVLVQGDTTTAFVSALAAFYAGIPVGHVEAGLRTHDPRVPFPEEMNRRLISPLAARHFAPTTTAEGHLLAEGIAPSDIIVTGNTSIDALFYMRERVKRPQLLDQIGDDRKIVLITAHRRESHGAGFDAICTALRQIATEHPELLLIYPVHPNPNVLRPVQQQLGNIENLRLIEPLPYPDFVAMMDAAHLIITDSGGIQEEAPSLGKPVLVMRDVTERIEAVEAGTVKLVGCNVDLIVSEARRLLTDADAYNEMSRAHNPYGDGNAAKYIIEDLAGS